MSDLTKAQLAALEKYVAWPRGLGSVFVTGAKPRAS